ncbi:phage tail-collar fiber domain-containing protein [Helicovermis profundi]|uniref:Phage tail fibre protein N-terminal domain-containing protein n=1 Tax=Helicovermis profundi TaxID=3065157 RepID=A0AAU9E2R3_9FIRM|nr:hypothetical protein HLPR_11550 [Clostridia bacterium S502]
MASFNSTVITSAGHSLMAKIMAGIATPTFTQVKVSDTDYSEHTSEELEALTSISDIKQSILVSNVSKVNDASVKVSAVLDNINLLVGYHLKTIGLYATDLDVGEILYSVTTAVIPDWIPPNTGINSTNIMIDLITVVSNASNISIEVDPNAMATVAQINTLKEEFSRVINNNWYADRPAYYGNTKLVQSTKNISAWTSGIGTLSVDKANFKIEDRCIKLDQPNNTSDDLYTTSHSAIAKDFTKLNNGNVSSDDDFINFIFFLSNKNMFTRVRIVLGPNLGTDFFDYSITSGLKDGWNYFHIKKSDFTFTGSPSWENITDTLYSALTTINASGHSVSFEDAILVKADPSGLYPNPFQKNGAAEINPLNSELFIGKEFGNIILRNLDDDTSNFFSYRSIKSYSFNGKKHIFSGRRKLISVNHDYMHLITLRDISNGENITFSIESTRLTAWYATFTKKDDLIDSINLVNGDYIDYSLEFDGNVAEIIINKNGDFGNPYILKVNYSSLVNINEAYIYFGNIMGRTNNLESISAAEIAHAHHSDIAEVAKGLDIQPYFNCNLLNTQLIPDSSPTKILFYGNNNGEESNGIILNEDSYFVIGESGRYNIYMQSIWAQNSTGVRDNKIVINDSTYEYDSKTTENISHFKNPTLLNNVHLKKGDNISFEVYQTSTTSISITGAAAANPATKISIYKVGA